MLLALFGPWISQVFLLWRNQCSDRSIKACSPTEQGYGKVHRGSCCDKYKSGSSSQVSVAFYRTGRGMSRQPWWFDGACSSGSQCTVRSTGACRPECCNSPGERAWWGLVMCSWPCNAPAVPTKKKKNQHAQTRKHSRVRWENPSKQCSDLVICRSKDGRMCESKLDWF